LIIFYNKTLPFVFIRYWQGHSLGIPFVLEKCLINSQRGQKMHKYYRFLFGLRKFLMNRIETQQAHELSEKILRQRVDNREENFLGLIEKGIFGFIKSPYLRLLSTRKIGFDDIKRWVEKDGMESALRTLRDEGIFFNVDEFKGKSEVSRNGIKFRVTEKDFDNPFLRAAYEVRSGATRSAGTRIRIDFDYLVQRSYYDAFILNVHDSLNSPIANWFPVFPGAPGINSSLRFARIGNPPKKWFTQVEKDHLKVNWEKRWGTNYIIYMSRLLGVPLAKPEFVDLNNAFKVAKWASEVLESNQNCVVYTFASSAVRVCMAARENNLNIRGTRFFVTGEPLTSQKKKEIEAMGARAVPIYGISEAGVIAAGCGQNSGQSDHCHTYKDTIAIIDRKRIVPNCETEVESLLFSTILYESPKILLNVEMGDYGLLEQRSCSCDYGALGFDIHISNIRSFEKLTGEGVTFVDTDFIKILEEILPARFGGESTDYQLLEEEENGLTYLNLLISPRVGDIEEKAVVETFVKCLKSAEDSPESWAQSGSEMWAQAGTLRVKRQNPIPTKRAKILPFHIVKPQN
jgi:hypothetical protein